MKKNIALKIFIFVLIFLFILFLFGLASTGYMPCSDKAKVATTKCTLATLHQMVHLFKLDTGRYPSAKEGLRELVEQPADTDTWCPGGYLEEKTVPLDAWKNDFIYTLSTDPNMPYDIVSYGADSKPGGTGYDADIHSRDLGGLYK